MRYNNHHPKSALDNYSPFTGWESQELEHPPNILKQLKNNLHLYENNYSRSQSKDIKKQEKEKGKKKQFNV